MLTEIFFGTPEKLKERLDVLIGTGRIINLVEKCTGGTYLIVHS